MKQGESSLKVTERLQQNAEEVITINCKYKARYVTFGCKVNQYETRCIETAFSEKGFVTASPEEVPDVIVINSCTVTGYGDSKSLYAVRKLRRDFPDSVIVLTGCLPQAAPEIQAELPEADIITGTKERKRIPELAEAALKERRRIVEIPEYGGSDDFEVMEYRSELSEGGGHTRAFVKIQDGCNCFCSYCIIPYARGRCRSKPPEVLREEARRIAAEGCREIVLTGINIAFYGSEYGLRLVDAVEMCCRTEGIDRVRLGSIEPEMLPEEDIRRLSELPEFCPQFHLSLQSGCGRTLKAMRRRYTPEEYYSLTRLILRYFPEAAFTTDIMVGFPGETEEDFAESLAFAEKVGFAKIHVFQYSPRKGTSAADMEQVPESVKKERADRMKALAAELRRRYLEKQVGKTVPVLFEREDSGEYGHGYAPDMTLVKIPGKKEKKSLRNSIFYVTIEESSFDHCTGRIITEL
ncbi:MAG: tRNA (N(6)-L-threonylcarbamoyladenosine(37)-C(2))-methylthiotransferase MtaB [Ruminococcus sp.]|nr:tRNA (N(6)-L-threonylcarbamoyladenosine(37)-C(2))-methylthiotransferase MtaB [Ruminococcus sp.]